MKKIISIIAILVSFSTLCHGIDFKDETLKYVVSYKWGLINKEAGDVTIKLKNNGEFYDLRMIGTTRSWADKIYAIRDTLDGQVAKDGFRPVHYKKMTHEKGKYSRDIISYEHTGNSTTGHAERLKINKKGEAETTTKLMHATGEVFDMLSVFFRLRRLDFASLAAGHEVVFTMFSGSKVELLTVTYIGKETVKLKDNTEHDAYHIKFKFTTEGKKKSSDDIDTWISDTPTRIPYLIVGNLPVGEIRCHYVGS